jgi:hypothetical protein
MPIRDTTATIWASSSHTRGRTLMRREVCRAKHRKMLPPPAGRMHVARTDPKALSSIRRCRCAFEGIGQPNDNHPMVEQSWDHGQDGGFLAAVLGGGAGKHRAHLSDERAARPERAGLVQKIAHFHQVLHNRESSVLQYAMRDRLMALLAASSSYVGCLLRCSSFLSVFWRTSSGRIFCPAASLFTRGSGQRHSIILAKKPIQKPDRTQPVLSFQLSKVTVVTACPFLPSARRDRF